MILTHRFLARIFIYSISPLWLLNAALAGDDITSSIAPAASELSQKLNFRPAHRKNTASGFRPTTLTLAQRAQLGQSLAPKSSSTTPIIALARTQKIEPPAQPPAHALTFKGKADDLVGRYSLWRASDKDTGCLMQLEKSDATSRSGTAQLAPACRDQGLVIFDAVKWRMEKSTLILTARLGHEISFYLSSPHIWTKIGGEHTSLSLHKL